MVTPEPEHSWRQVEHTADLAIAISSTDKAGLFRAAFAGMLGILEIDLTPPRKKKRTTEYQLDQNSGSIEGDLVDFLNECVFLMEVEELVPFKIQELEYNENGLDATILCRSVIESDSEAVGQIKAATYSDLEVKQADDRYQATLIFDT